MELRFLVAGVMVMLAGCGQPGAEATYRSVPTPKVASRALPQQAPQYPQEEEVALPGNFNGWLNDVKKEAAQKGIRKEIIAAAFEGFDEPIERVVRLDRKQPEGTIEWPQYRTNVITDKRIAEGRALFAQHKGLLEKISRQFGVQPEFIVALWGIETSYGKVTGNYEIPHALATLAFEGRRADFFRKELMDSLVILNEGHIPPHEMIGSWAGAMGQCQFMPSSFRAMAVDFDGDGHKNIWTSQPDVFASIANYLSKSGWNSNVSWGQAVKLPANFNMSLEGRTTKKSIGEWAALGVTQENGAPLNGSGAASIVIPKGSPTAFLTTSNYDVVMKWNRSTFFATAVGQLADAIRQ
jgi:membrane-bound lytic murein transglycosylase B